MIRHLPVLPGATSVRCDRLRCILAIASCVQRYLLAEAPRRVVARDGRRDLRRDWLLTCRGCPQGAERAAGRAA